MAAALTTFLGGVAWALTAPGLHFTWPRSMVSDLGAATCLATDGRWVCSARHTAFNAAQIAAGALMLAAAALAVAVTVSRPARALRGGALQGGAFTAAQVSIGAGLLLLGAFPSDTAHAPHMVGAVLALPVAGAFLLVHALCTPVGSPRRGLRLALALLVLVPTLVHMANLGAIRGAAEAVSLAGLCGALVCEAVWLVRDACAPRAQPPR